MTAVAKGFKCTLVFTYFNQGKESHAFETTLACEIFHIEKVWHPSGGKAALEVEEGLSWAAGKVKFNRKG